ncbi:MAG: hypothetical protein ACE5JR_09810 [Gemmatimonadota bacterium]
MGKRMVLIACASLFLLGVSDLNAQARFGGQLSFGDSQDVGLGARLMLGVESLKRVEFNGSFDYFFPDEPVGGDRDYWELNGNLAYFFDVGSATSLAPYAGGGLNIAHGSRTFSDGRDTSDTDLGLNLLGGTRFGSGPVIPFAELRVEVSGGEQFLITGGVIF